MRVFLSSTFSDLVEHRKAVGDAIKSLEVPHGDFELVRAEDLGPSDRPVIEALTEQVKAADIFVLVLGWRYGYVPEGGTKSIIELEYDAAKESDKLIVPFIADDTYPVQAGQIETGAQGEQLRRLKERVRREQVVRTFKGPDDLAKEAAIAVSRWYSIGMHDVAKEVIAAPELRSQVDALRSERSRHLELIEDLRATLGRVVPAEPIWRSRNFNRDSTLCFCLLPLQDEFVRVFEEGTLPAVQAAGLRGIHAGQIFDNREIVEDIWELICTARVVVADVTGRNPNVFYELGICHTLGKEVIVITQAAADVPFDIRHRRFIEYDPAKMTTLKTKLQQTVQRVLTRSGGA